MTPNIVNITSIAGLRPVGSSMAYSMTKAALNQMTLLLAKSYGPIRVNAVRPGLVATPWTQDWDAMHAASRQDRAGARGRRRPTTAPRPCWRSCATSTPPARSSSSTEASPSRRTVPSGGGLLEDVDAAGRAEADHVGQADLGALDLAVAGFTAKVVADLPDVGDAGRRDRVALRLQAARHVDRQCRRRATGHPT